MLETHDTCLIDERVRDSVGEPDVQQAGDLRADAPRCVLRSKGTAGFSKGRQDQAYMRPSHPRNYKPAQALIDCDLIKLENGRVRLEKRVRNHLQITFPAIHLGGDFCGALPQLWTKLD
jgi:hypothetical protein